MNTFKRILYLRASIGCILCCCLFIGSLDAQVMVYGIVYDEKELPLQGVSVISQRQGKGVTTNLQGNYSLKVYRGDTVVFSLLGFKKVYLPVNQELGTLNKKIYLIPDHQTLEQVQVTGRRNRQRDSIMLRTEYGHIFDYKPPSVLDYGALALSSPITFLGKLFNFKGRKRNKQFKETLLHYEKQQFIESRIPYSLVTELTGLEGTERAAFYQKYLFDYEFVKYANDYDIRHRITESFKKYQEEKKAPE